MPLSLDEFLRRFLLHLRPKGFVPIRHFGFLANRRRATLLPLCFQVLNAVQPSHTESEASLAKEPTPLWLCPKCGGPMVVIERLTAAQLQLRSPPFLAGAAACNKSKPPLSVRFATCRSGALFFPPNKALRFQSPLKVLLHRPQTTTQPILPALLFAPRLLPDAFLITPTPLNLHKCLPPGRLPSNSCIGRAPHDLPNPPALL